MTAQVAVCTLLLSAAGLMIRSFQESLATDPGFRTERLIAVQYHPGNAGYTASRMAAFRQRLNARLQSATHVRAFAQAAAPPLSDRPTIALLVSGSGTSDRSVNSPFNKVSPNYFELLGIPVVDGRTFTAVEMAAGLPVAVVSQATARRLWPGESAIGKRFRVLEEGAPVREVVGVAGDTRSVWLSRVDEDYLYLPFDPNTTEPSALLVDVDRDTVEARLELISALRSVDAELPLSVQPLRELLNQWRLLPLAASALATSLAVVALALAGVGMFGVTSYVTGQRTREFGIRMALGATRGASLAMVFRQGTRVVGVGLAIGWIGAVALGRLLMGSFYGVRPYDPASLAFAVVFLGTAALAAMYGLASRAAKIDPIASLRQD
jgi:predicted permease